MKKGFTLVELLAVIVLLSLILGILAPKVIDIIGNQNAKLRVQSINNIERAARNYVIDNNTTIGYPTTKITVTLTTLAENSYLDSDEIKDPTTDEPFSGYITVRWINNDYEIKYVE